MIPDWKFQEFVIIGLYIPFNGGTPGLERFTMEEEQADIHVGGAMGGHGGSKRVREKGSGHSARQYS